MMQRCIPLYLLAHGIKYALVPIGYDANLPTRPKHMYLDQPQEPSPAIFVLLLNQSKCQRNQLVVRVTGYDYKKCALVFANQERTINGEDGTIVRQCLKAYTLREAPESTKEYLPPILPCIWFWDVLIMHA